MSFFGSITVKSLNFMKPKHTKYIYQLNKIIINYYSLGLQIRIIRNSLSWLWLTASDWTQHLVLHICECFLLFESTCSCRRWILSGIPITSQTVSLAVRGRLRVTGWTWRETLKPWNPEPSVRAVGSASVSVKSQWVTSVWHDGGVWVWSTLARRE